MKLVRLLELDFIKKVNDNLYLCNKCLKVFSKLGVINHHFYCHEEEGIKKKQLLKEKAVKNNNMPEMKKKISEKTKEAFKRKEVQENFNTYVKRIKKERIGKGNPMYGKKQSEEWRRLKVISSRLTIEQIREKYPFFSRIEEMRYNPDKPGENEIQVHCRNHNCPNSKEQGGWFTPTSLQFQHRRDFLEHEGADKSNFYCSEECKQSCPLFNFKGSLKITLTKPYTQEEYQTFREFVLERDNYECQYCGELAEHVHHERPQKLEPFFALDPDLAWSVCSKCHYIYGHRDECAQVNIANTKCKE